MKDIPSSEAQLVLVAFSLKHHAEAQASTEIREEEGSFWNEGEMRLLIKEEECYFKSQYELLGCSFCSQLLFTVTFCCGNSQVRDLENV